MAVQMMVPRVSASQIEAQIGLIHLSDLPDGDGFHRSWVMVLPEGKFDHPEFGELNFTQPILQETIQNFNEKARGIDIALDYDHKANKGESAAPGWIEQLQYRPAQGDVPAGLWARVRWTELGLHDVKAQIYRYLSAEFRENYTNDITGKRFNNVLTGLTLTNRPFMKQMPAIMLSEVSTKAWGSVNKSMLPRSAFLIKGDPDKKSTWKLPIYEGTGPKDADGCYTQRGKLNIHGVKAALAAIHGARSGKPMSGVPAGTVKRLEALLAKYSQSGETKSESGDGGTGMAERDLNDLSLYEDAEESARYELADSKASTKKAKQQAPAYDNDADDDELAENEDDADMMDDGEDDSESYDDRDEDSGDEDIDHLPGDQKNRKKAKGKGGDAKMSEYDDAVTLDELRRELAELRRENYASKAEVILAGFERGTFQFSATEARTVSKKTGQPLDGKTIKRTGNYKLAPKALKAVREWLFSDAAFTLSESSRRDVLRVFETIAAGVVDLSVRGSSHDMEREKTVSLKSPRERAVSKLQERDVLLAETAAEIAAERGKDIDTLRKLQTQYYTREGIEASQELKSIYALAESRVQRAITAAE